MQIYNSNAGGGGALKLERPDPQPGNETFSVLTCSTERSVQSNIYIFQLQILPTIPNFQTFSRHWGETSTLKRYSTGTDPS